VALDGDPEVMRHLTGRARTREEVLTEWLPVLERDTGPGGQLGYWAGVLVVEWSQTPPSGADFLAFGTNRKSFVGWWALNPAPDDPGEAELGYRLRREAWGHGYASEGAQALLTHGFDTVGLEHVWAQTMAVNTRSVAVMGRIGLRYERTWVGEWNEPLPGWEEGEVAYGLTRAQWLESYSRGTRTP
jgi:RimJ/RimL family protein N-acetyltransferase